MHAPPTDTASSRAIQLAAALPGIAAVMVGALYALGAATKAAQLEAADLRATDGLSLVPLDQLLTEGIRSSVIPAVSVAVILIAVALVLRSLRQTYDVRASIWRPESDARIPIPKWQPIGLLALTVLLTAPIFSWSLVVAFALALSVAFAGLRYAENRPHDQRFGPVAITVVVTFTMIVGGLIGERLAYPSPLPNATVMTTKGEAVRGRLIVVANATWFLGTGSETYQGVPVVHVRKTVVVSREHRDEPPSALEEVTGSSLDDLLGLPER